MQIGAVRRINVVLDVDRSTYLYRAWSTNKGAWFGVWIRRIIERPNSVRVVLPVKKSRGRVRSRKTRCPRHREGSRIGIDRNKAGNAAARAGTGRIRRTVVSCAARIDAAITAALAIVVIDSIRLTVVRSNAGYTARRLSAQQ